MRNVFVATIAIAIIALVAITFQRETKHKEITVVVPPSQTGSGIAALYGWGGNTENQISGSKEKIVLTPFKISDADASAIVAAEVSAAILVDGKSFGWGANEIHQVNESEEMVLMEPSAMAFPENTTMIASTNRHTLGLTANGKVFAQGYNFTGQIGNGTNDGEKTPVEVKGLPDISAIAAGYKFSLALSEDGAVYGWGGLCATAGDRALVDFVAGIGGAYYEPNVLPRVRTSANEDCVNEKVVGILSRSSKKFESIDNVSAISAGYGHGIFLKKDGTVWTFGCNLYGQLGNRGTSNTVKNAVPNQVENLSSVTAVAAGFRHSLALDANGKVYTWGGKIAEGKDGAEAVKDNQLIAVTGLPPIAKIFAGRDYSLALTADGKLFGWGSNAHHQLSPENTLVFAEPIEIATPGKVLNVAAGQTFVLATIETQ